MTRAPAAAAAATSATSAVTRKLRAVSFNVDGLDDLELQARTFEVCSILAAPTAGLSSAPDIIMLQEVVPSTLSVFRQRLGNAGYDCISDRADAAPGFRAPYFTTIFVYR